MVLINFGLELFGHSLRLCGLNAGFLFDAFEMRYLPPRFIFIGAELQQLAVHLHRLCTFDVQV
jgi:hypothetical protein